MKHIRIIKAVLNLFDGEGSASGAGATAAQNTGTSFDNNQGDTKRVLPNTRGAKKTGEFDNVVFGKQPKAADNGSSAAGSNKTPDVSTTSDTADERKSRYNDLIRGEFKEVYQADVQSIINRRFKETKGYEERLASQQPIIDALMDKYGISDTGKLIEAIDKDNSFWREIAEDAGFNDVEQYRQFVKMKRENEKLNAEKKSAADADAQRATVQRWMTEAQAMSADYPGFDLNAEVQNNPRFLSLLKSGVPVRDAYEVIHLGEIKKRVADSASASAEKRVTDNVRARGSRPSENGTSSQSGPITYKTDVNKLTKKERAEVARRAMRGERIEF